jgi:DNA-binding PadR family transcriptional regulator
LGQELDPNVIQELTNEQKAQLERLKEEADAFRQKIMEEESKK